MITSSQRDDTRLRSCETSTKVVVFDNSFSSSTMRMRVERSSALTTSSARITSGRDTIARAIGTLKQLVARIPNNT